MGKINLEEIFDSYSEVDCDYCYTKESIFQAMREACRRTLELVSGLESIADRQSILDTINQVE